MSSRRKSRVFAYLTFLTLIAVTFSAGMLFGERSSAAPSFLSESGISLSQEDAAGDSEDVDFKQFWKVWGMMRGMYYEQPVSDRALYDGAMRGMVASMGDPYTVYFDREETKSFKSMLSGSFGGIGAEIGSRDGTIVVIAPLKDSPAEKAGLAEGDAILSIDGTDTAGFSVDQAVSIIRGEEGTDVTLTIVPKNGTSAEDIVVTRQIITIDSVKWSVDTDGIATVSIAEFNNDTTALFTQAVNDILSKNAKGIILDLRSDPGGLLTTAINVASAWIGYQPVVIEKHQDSARSYPGVTAPRLAGIPTVVLVDGGSASASEIVAGALQDYGLATLVGTQTFGKGSVQDYRDLPDGASVKITIAAWYTPNGRTINKTGSTPDTVVDYTQEDAHAKRDPQKEKAVEIINEAASSAR